jgi:MFS family permease
VALLAVPLLDEVSSGVAPAGAPEIARELDLPGGLTAGGIVTAFYGLALLEAPILAWTERASARVVSVISLLAMAIATLGMGWAPHVSVLAASLALYGPGAGLALAVAEGVLVEARDAHSRERVLARVTFAAAVGDLLTPIALAGASLVGLTWRDVAFCAGLLGLLLVASHVRLLELDRAMPSDDDEEDAGEPHLARSGLGALREALSQRPLIGWSLAGTLTGLMDEVLMAFSALHLASIAPGEDTVAARQLALVANIAGGLVGLAWLERSVEGRDPRRVLLLACVLSGVSLGGVAIAPDLGVAAVALFVLGAGSAVLHPLVKARPYEALPGRPQLVNAVGAALVPIDALAPLLVGFVALHHGSALALGSLGVAPLGVALAALWLRAAPRLR